MTLRPEARTQARTNLFVLANIASATACGPVKVRNLSPNGAMIEGATLPAPGAAAELRRGDTRVTGTVVWCRGGKAGLRFDGRVDVSEWLPGGHAGQKQVDEVFQQFKASPASSPCAPGLASTLDAAITPGQLRNLARDLDSLADELADDLAIVSRYATKLQLLDLASQVLRKLSGRQV